MRPRSPGCGVNVTVGAVDRYRPGGVTSAAGTTCVAAALQHQCSAGRATRTLPGIGLDATQNK